MEGVEVLIQRMVKKQLVLFVKRIAPVIPSLYVVDADIPVSELSKDEEKLEKGRYYIEFNKWDASVNEEQTQFLSISGSFGKGLSENDQRGKIVLDLAVNIQLDFAQGEESSLSCASSWMEVQDNEVYSAIKESPDEAPEKWSHAQAKEGHL
ncbi:hypothetical protein J5N97_018554 [Dioscorea zingiberensis]|uniref:Uncharacterized protein n=1 Tax=Dioscorea zingiberensis TaxID=325984 RepID=A0A9D5CD83_9LILI|nr:hypothetical protein J5N97_018554 [Dioscorea zingiberensis]